MGEAPSKCKKCSSNKNRYSSSTETKNNFTGVNSQKIIIENAEDLYKKFEEDPENVYQQLLNIEEIIRRKDQQIEGLTKEICEHKKTIEKFKIRSQERDLVISNLESIIKDANQKLVQVKASNIVLKQENSELKQKLESFKVQDKIV